MKEWKLYREVTTFINKRTLENESFNELRRKSYQFNLKLIVVMLIFVNMAILAFYIFPLIENKRKMPLPAYVPIDFYEHGRIYVLFYIFIMFACWLSSLVTPFGCLFFSSIIGFLSNEFKILGFSYDEALKEDHSLVKIKGDMKKNISHHQDLLKIFNIIQDVLYIPMLIQLGVSSLLISFTGFEMLTTHNIFSIKFLARIQHLTYTLFELFIYCYQSEELMFQV